MSRTALLALMLAAALPLRAARAQDDDDYRSKVDTTLAFDKHGSVTLSLQTGEIIVRGWNRDQIHIRAYAERSQIRVDASPTRLSLELGRERGGDAHFEVTVPEGARISASAVSGDITISGTKGGVDAQTQSGDIEVEDAADMIDLVSVSGDVRGSRLSGDVEARAISGDITLTDVHGDVEGSSVSGDIEIRDAVSKYARARSTSGDVSYDGVIDSAGRYELGSHSGSVDLTIPQGSSATFNVATYNGSIDSDFPITLQPGDHGLGNSKRFTFSIGHGDGRISAESFSGDITIRSSGRSTTRSPN
jgi:Putative adhesin